MPRAGYGPTLVLSLTLACALFLLLMAALLLVVHPGSGAVATEIVRQRQSAKTILYVVTFLAILPVSLVAGSRLAGRVAAGPNGGALTVLASALAALLALALILVRVLPIWSHGLGPVLGAVALWWVVAVAVLMRTMRSRPWPSLLRLGRASTLMPSVALAGVLGTLLCVTALGSLSAVGLAAGAVAALVSIWAWQRLSVPRAGFLGGGVIDLVVGLLLLLAVVNVVVYEPSATIPNVYFPPGIVQFQQDWMLAPANQLLAGGALLVNVPSSQYGVGLVYFLAGWFHLVPIGYATFGLLDGILTALVYVCGYVILRIAGISRLLAAASLALGVAVFIYHLVYPVGSLPEQGPLRFGLPMALIVAMLVAARWSRLAVAARTGALVVLGIASVWALESFAYTLFTFAVMISVETALRPAGLRRRWVLPQAGLAVAACLTAHVILAGSTLAATGQLPDWSQYLAHLSTLLGGQEGSITYGFADWSPGLAFGAACVASAAALALLTIRKPGLARTNRTLVLAVAGCTAYAIGSFSYSDNRSSTYLLPYVALPLLLAGALWLHLFLGAAEVPAVWRRAGLSAALALAVLMLAAAWPTIGNEFSQSALAHAYPGGELGSSLDRLWHAPPIDPRAPTVQRMLRRYLPARHVLILLPTAPDLALEALMRAGKANSLFLGDPAEDIWVPSIWIPKIRRQIARLRPGGLALVDRTGLALTSRLRGRSAGYVLGHPLLGGSAQIEWILHVLRQRFSFVPIRHGPLGLVVVRLASRPGAG